MTSTRLCVTPRSRFDLRSSRFLLRRVLRRHRPEEAIGLIDDADDLAAVACSPKCAAEFSAGEKRFAGRKLSLGPQYGVIERAREDGLPPILHEENRPGPFESIADSSAGHEVADGGVDLRAMGSGPARYGTPHAADADDLRDILLATLARACTPQHDVHVAVVVEIIIGLIEGFLVALGITGVAVIDDLKCRGADGAAER